MGISNDFSNFKSQSEGKKTQKINENRKQVIKGRNVFKGEMGMESFQEEKLETATLAGIATYFSLGLAVMLW